MDSTGELTCKELVELVTDYLEGALPDTERARFEAHIAECPYCHVYLEQMRQTIRMLGKLTEDAISIQARQELLRVFQNWRESKQP